MNVVETIGSITRVLERPLVVGDSFTRCDAIVILGAPLASDGSLSRSVRERVAAGLALWTIGGAPIICVTGGVTGDRAALGARAEADVMAEALLHAGVPRSALRIERRARSTRDNAICCKELLVADGVRSAWIVTQPFHGRRARHVFTAAGFDARVWHIDGSLEYADRAAALRWVLREYAAWARQLAREVASVGLRKRH